jgi:hypothetical protein
MKVIQAVEVLTTATTGKTQLEPAVAVLVYQEPTATT